MLLLIILMHALFEGPCGALGPCGAYLLITHSTEWAQSRMWQGYDSVENNFKLSLTGTGRNLYVWFLQPRKFEIIVVQFEINWIVLKLNASHHIMK